MITDTDLDTRLRHGDPARTNAASDRALDAVLRSTELVAQRPNWRRRIVTGFGVAGVVILGGAIAAPAAADVFRFLAQTDWRCTSGTECGNPDAEWIDSSAADTPEYVASVFPDDIPFSNTWTREAATERVSRALTENPGTISEVSVQRMFESIAYCSWVEGWLAADAGKDLTTRDAATRVLRAATEWPAMTATDGGGIMDRQRTFAAAAEAGDRAGVEEALLGNECAGWRE